MTVDEPQIKYRTDTLGGLMVSGRLDAHGGGWCWYRHEAEPHGGRYHARAETKRTPCCGDCWYDTAPDEPYEDE